jgi:hypothetical protein
MSIPSVEGRKEQVFQITVIWCGTNKATTRSQCTITALNESVGIINVLDYFRADHKIEWFAVQFRENIVITCEDFESRFGVGAPRDFDAIRTRIDPNNAAALR